MTNKPIDIAWVSIAEADRARQQALLEAARRRNRARAYSAQAAAKRRLDKLVRRLLEASIVIFLVVSVLDHWVR